MEGNTIKPSIITGEEYVIIKNLENEYNKKKEKTVKKIFEQIRENHLKKSKENNS